MRWQFIVYSSSIAFLLGHRLEVVFISGHVHFASVGLCIVVAQVVVCMSDCFPSQLLAELTAEEMR